MKYVAGFASATALITLAGAAHAQSINDARAADNPAGFRRENTAESVQDRAAKNNQALGVHVGAFRVDPVTTAAVEYTDNVFATDTNKQSDTVGVLRAQLNVNSLWSRHALGAYLTGEVDRYNDFKSENEKEWSAGVTGRLDLGTDTVVNGLLSHDDLQEPRTSSASPSIAADLVQYRVDTATIGAARTFNRFRLSGVATVRDYDFDDVTTFGGSIIDEQYRDVTATSLRGRLDYALSPDTSVFVEVSHTIRDYRTQSAGYNRDNNSTLALVGASTAITTLVRGEIGVGYLQSNHDDPTRPDVDGFGARAAIEYFPTDLLTVSVQASRAFQDVGIREATGSINTDFDLRFDYEIRRNLIGSGRFGYSVDDYEDVVRTDKRTRLGLGLAYYFYHAASLNFNYDYIKQDSTGTLGITGRDFDVNLFTAGVTIRY